MIYKVHHLHCGTMCPMCAPLYGQKGLYGKNGVSLPID